MNYLLAQRASWEALGKEFSGRNADVSPVELWWVAAIAIGLGLLIWGLRWAAANTDPTSTKRNPGRLFRELCRAHGVSYSDRMLLKRLAKAVQAQAAADVFLRPDWFRSKQIPDELAGYEGALQELGQQLFGDLRRRKKTANVVACEKSDNHRRRPRVSDDRRACEDGTSAR